MATITEATADSNRIEWRVALQPKQYAPQFGPDHGNGKEQRFDQPPFMAQEQVPANGTLQLASVAGSRSPASGQGARQVQLSVSWPREGRTPLLAQIPALLLGHTAPVAGPSARGLTAAGVCTGNARYVRIRGPNQVGYGGRHRGKGGPLSHPRSA